MPLLQIWPVTIFAVLITTPQWPLRPAAMLGVATICAVAIVAALVAERRQHRS